MNNEHKYLQWFSSKTKSIYWHDSAVRAEQQAAFANGATGMTTNPFLIQSTLNGDRAFWAERLAAIPQDLKGDEKVAGRGAFVLKAELAKGEAEHGH